MGRFGRRDGDRRRRRARSAGVLLVACLCLMAGAAAAMVTFERGSLVIETAGGPHRFDVELARTPEQRAQGLMFRDKLAADAGMLFLYKQEQPVMMWMENTLIPLDMLFIARDGRIINIAERAVPLSTEVIPSQAPALGVLELNGGAAQRLGIKPGDRVRYPAFGD